MSPQSGEQPFTFHVASPLLRTGESYAQVLASLSFVSDVADKVFDQIMDRVNEERTRVASVLSRVEDAHARIERIRGSTKATRVFSTPKYPAPQKLPQFEALFSKIEPCSVDLATDALVEDSPLAAGLGADSVELFTEVALNEKSRRSKEKVQASQEGLGRLPENIGSVSDLLLFNSAENPYKKYISIDNLAGVDARAKEEEAEKGLAAAPLSVLEGDMLPEFAAVNFGFNPKLGEVPEINVPDVLPDLAGIADINWADGGLPALPSIAPSQVMASLPSLPMVEAPPPKEGELGTQESAGAPPPP
eukprot:CAMPEP_0113870996 /NCGR_PEP_ID=MMETSP0780_2-20120614/2393_1 /TAXON_ID=652834 /ORGANISM="Palpitomonas bilix" /LENGTH=304 /DNA_ID=CAMNT_0000856329 /DNA_START=50 /DNA_END=961 /DNA_ORIENTATION=- /assembly_acc=CAM_ASM_000599